ncbi:hypothetical protein BGZ80_005603 [Entomortierella chlamydospora]|uniref:Uncharacterized protein n=1 Tax=Entomortierella chlamydospora TaxID=101097 RepID=A0A9P6SUJ7_9FUNG|nr:hypothetical protein BGZ80_005603 [Entomortierella chlamydospora]
MWLSEQEREEFVSLLAARARNGKILFILDGLDEISTDTQTIRGVALEPFLKHLLRQKHVVVTSRPSGVDNSILPELDLELETVGFSKQNVNDYLSNILKPEDSRAVRDFIKRTPSIQSLANIPVQLDVICYSWDSLSSNEQSITMTGLYQTIVRRLRCKDAERLQKEVETSLTSQRIQRLPQYQMNRLIAIESEYLSFLAFKADAELNAGKDDSQHAWYFLHLTFQEYFAASSIVRHLQIKPKIGSTLTTSEKTKAHIQRHKYNPRYQIVWWMVAGMLHEEDLASFFELLQGVPADLIGGYHHHLLAGCLNEARGQLDDKSVENVEMQLRQWLQLKMMVNDNGGGKSVLGGMSYFPEELLIRSIGQPGATRSYLIRTLAMRASLTQPSIEVLLKTLQDVQGRNLHLRGTVVETLGKQPTLPESTLQTLVDALQDRNWYVRSSAAEVLGKRPTLPRSTLQALIGGLRDNYMDVRKSAAEALGKQSTLPEPTLQTLVGVLQDKDWYFRKSAAELLGKQSTLLESTLQALVGALQAKDWYVKKSAAEALGKQSILPESTLQALVGALQREDWGVGKPAAEVLGNQSALPESTLTALVGALQGANWNVAKSAALILGKQSTLPESTLQALDGALHHENEGVRKSATIVLGKQLELPESTLRALAGALQDNDWNVRKSAAEVLGTQSILHVSAIQALVGALQDKDRFVRKRVV